jgi:hypothetical protein
VTAYPLGVQVSCDGPDEQADCPASAAIPANCGSLTAREVRADGRDLGWTHPLRAGHRVDLCPRCTPA